MLSQKGSKQRLHWGTLWASLRDADAAGTAHTNGHRLNYNRKTQWHAAEPSTGSLAATRRGGLLGVFTGDTPGVVNGDALGVVNGDALGVVNGDAQSERPCASSCLSLLLR